MSQRYTASGSDYVRELHAHTHTHRYTDSGSDYPREAAPFAREVGGAPRRMWPVPREDIAKVARKYISISISIYLSIYTCVYICIHIYTYIHILYIYIDIYI